LLLDSHIFVFEQLKRREKKAAIEANVKAALQARREEEEAAMAAAAEAD
jgi:hypothetical protein